MLLCNFASQELGFIQPNSPVAPHHGFYSSFPCSSRWSGRSASASSFGKVGADLFLIQFLALHYPDADADAIHLRLQDSSEPIMA